jgi:hypothetical protein
MTWVKLDDQFPDHPKVIEAGPMASWLYVCGLAYANRFLTDGFIPERQAHRLVDLDDLAPMIDRLVSVGLWEIVEGGYHIHDFLEYQPSAEKVKAERAANAERQARWRDRNAEDNGVSNAVTNELRNGVTNSAPSRTRTRTRPIPVPEPGPTPVEDAPGKPAPKQKRACRLPDDFTLTEARERYAASKGLGTAEIAHQFEKFLVYWRGVGKAHADWDATWQRWVLTAIERGEKLRGSPNGKHSEESEYRRTMRELESIAQGGKA